MQRPKENEDENITDEARQNNAEKLRIMKSERKQAEAL